MCTFNISDTANTIMRSFTLKIDQIAVTLLLIFFAMFNYSMILGDNYSSKDYVPSMFNERPICQTMRECFMVVSNVGLRLGGGISDAMYIVDLGDAGYYGRWFFSVTFFLLINLVGLQITLGSIIDAFSYMRDLRNERGNFFLGCEKIE
jgi:Na+/alanine symporter